jgi:antirestriction protein ArdC
VQCATTMKPRGISFLKRFTVFNTDQCDDLPEEVATGASPVPEGLILPQAEALIEATGADLRIRGDRAYYDVTADYICVPPPQAYFEPVNWHRTALHELGHNAETRIMPRDPNWRRNCGSLAMRCSA